MQKLLVGTLVAAGKQRFALEVVCQVCAWEGTSTPHFVAALHMREEPPTSSVGVVGASSSTVAPQRRLGEGTVTVKAVFTLPQTFPPP
jgi:hypothetical protein